MFEVGHDYTFTMIEYGMSDDAVFGPAGVEFDGNVVEIDGLLLKLADGTIINTASFYFVSAHPLEDPNPLAVIAVP